MQMNEQYTLMITFFCEDMFHELGYINCEVHHSFPSQLSSYSYKVIRERKIRLRNKPDIEKVF